MKTVGSACAREHLPELLEAVSENEQSATQKPAPQFGTGKGKIKILDPHWADPMTDDEVDAFLEGRY